MHRPRRPVLCPTVICALIPTAALPAADTVTQPAGIGALDPKVEAILDRQETRGRSLRSVRCDLEYVKEDPVVDSKTTLKGELRYMEAEPNPLFFIEFTSSVKDGRRKDEKEWHVFDGRWYIEAREVSKNIIKHEVLRPGEKKNVFRLGEGPFPVPFGQKKADIVETFDIKWVPPGPKDPPGAETDHLECTPKPGTEIARRHGAVHFWIDKKLDLPVKMSTVNKEEEDQTITANFRNLQINKNLVGSDMNLPKLDGYEVSEDPLPPAPTEPAGP